MPADTPTPSLMQSHPRALLAALGALLGGGGGALLAARENAREGETRNERTARIVRNSAVGAGLGAGGLASVYQGADLLQNSALGKSYIQKAKELRNILFGGPIMAGGVGAAAGATIGTQRGHSLVASKLAPVQANLDKAEQSIANLGRGAPGAPPPLPGAPNSSPARLVQQLKQMTAVRDTLSGHVKDIQAGAANTVRNRAVGGAAVGAGLGLAPEIWEAVSDYTPQGAVLTPALAGGAVAYAAKRHPAAAIGSLLAGLAGSGWSAYHAMKP